MNNWLQAVEVQTWHILIFFVFLQRYTYVSPKPCKNIQDVVLSWAYIQFNFRNIFVPFRKTNNSNRCVSSYIKQAKILARVVSKNYRLMKEGVLFRFSVQKRCQWTQRRRQGKPKRSSLSVESIKDLKPIAAILTYLSLMVIAGGLICSCRILRFLVINNEGWLCASAVKYVVQ